MDPALLPRKPVPKTRVDRSKTEDNEHAHGRIDIFGKKLGWLWIALALLLVLGVIVFLFITFTRHRRRIKTIARKMRNDDIHNLPSCRVHKTTSTLDDPNIINGIFCGPDRVSAVTVLTEMPLKCSNKFRLRRGPLVKPEDEWRGRSGVEWLILKKRQLVEGRTCRKKHIHVVETMMANYRAQSLLPDQNWTSVSGVFDIFELVETMKEVFRQGGSSTTKSRLRLQLPFDTDVQKFLRRLDGQYSHKNWWK